MQLRDYQLRDLERIRETIRQGNRRIVYKAPTGSGKTVLSGYFAKKVSDNKKSLFFIVHRRELLNQASDTFAAFDVPHGRIAPGFPETDHLIQVVSIDAMNARIKRGRTYKPDVIICDESHHCAGKNKWAKGIENISNNKTIIIGVTGTPERADGKGLKSMFNTLILGPETRGLIEQKYLCPFEHFAPPSSLDLSDIRIVNGDYDQIALSDIVNEPKIIGDAVRHYKGAALGKRAVYFCVGIKHSQNTAEAFQKAGIAATHIDGKNTANRIEAVEMFARNEIQVITNCDIVSEGFDIPSMEVVGMLRPTKSLVLYLQQAGRALRVDPTNPNKKALILDHAGNIHTHGMIDEVREWSLEGKKKRTKNSAVTPVRQCPKCFMVHSPAYASCPSCGHEYDLGDREPNFQEGSLEAVNSDIIAKQKEVRRKIIEVAKANSLEELIAIGKARGYKPGWAHVRWKFRKSRGH